MKRRILNMIDTQITAHHFHRFFTLHPSRLRKMISVALIITFVLAPLLNGHTPALAQINTCGGATRIFQGCPLNPQYEVGIENKALDHLLDFHQLPAADRSRLLGWQRNKLRALLHAELLNLINKAPAERTPEETAAYNALANRIKQLRVTAAQKAIDEYNIWNGNPCNYQPPPGFSYSGRLLCAAARLNPAAAGPIDPPKFEEFQAYGVARAYDRLNSVEAQKVAAETARAEVFFGSLGGAAVGGGIAALATYIYLTEALATATIFAEVFEDVAVESLVAVASGLGSFAAAVGGAVLTAIAAIVIGVMRGIDVANIVAIPGKLQDTLNTVTNAPAPDLKQLIATDQGKQELYAAFLLMTLPDFPSTDPVPAPQASDPKFILQQQGSNTTTQVSSFSYKTWAGTTDSVRLNGGWFINKFKDQNNQDKEVWALEIEYVDWNGQRCTAGRSGGTFIHTIVGAPERTFQSPEIKYQDGNGNKFTASLLLPELSIEALPVVLDRGHQGSGFEIAPQTLPVARVNSGSQAPNTLSISVNNAASVTVTGVTLSDLSIDSTGLVTASLKAECTAIAPTFTLRITDNVGQSKTVPLAIQLSPIADKPYNPLEVSLPNGEVGVPYNGLVSGFFILAGFCNVSDQGLTVTSGKLPPGLSLGSIEVCDDPPPPAIRTCNFSGTGVTGTPTCAGLYTFTVRKNYSNGDNFSRTYAVIIDSPPVPLPSGAISWWSGEHGLNDDLKQNDLSVAAGFNKNNFAPGKVNLAFSFDGSNAAVQLPDNAFPFNAANNPPFTFETWFKTSTNGVIIGRQNGTPYSSSPSANTPGIYVGTDGKLRVQMFTDSTGSVNPITSPSVVNDDVFHHIAVIYDGTQEVVYLDGSPMGSDQNAQAVISNTFKYQIGTGYTQGWPASNGTWFNFNGLIDEPTLYSRALSAEEVHSIFAAGSAGKIAITPTSYNPSCPGANNGVVTVNVLGGRPPFTFAMDDDSYQPETVFDGLAVGNHTLKVKDIKGHVFTKSVTLTDPPTLTFSASVISPTCGGTGGSITINATGGSGALMYSINNGQNFQTGNVFSNLASGTYQVVVKDANSCTTAAESVTLNAPPVARAKNVTIASGANCMADASVDDGSYDPDSGDTITVTQSPAGPYPLGNTTVTLTVTDSHGASCSSTATVTVIDQTAPSLTVKPAITIFPPNHSYQAVTMSQMVASVGDCATSLSLNDVVIEKVTSDEPDDAPGNSDGITTNDIVIAADCKSVQLRAERNDTLNGRVYVITLRVRDAAGNTTRKDFKVSVPLGQDGVPAVQDATAQTKTSSCQ